MYRLSCCLTHDRVFPILMAVFAAAGALAIPGHASAGTFGVVHTFCAKPDCTDGSTPQYGLTADANGVLYGTTAFGGSGNSGIAYALTPNGSGYNYSVLYRFCTVGICSDGVTPESPLIIDSKGNLYGTTELGGAYNRGVLFELRPNADRTKWTEIVRYSFCSGGDPCADGRYPNGQLTYTGAQSGAAYDGVSPIFGITFSGGTGNGGSGSGTVFRLTPVTGHTLWKHKVIYSFCSQPSCTDGATPEGGLISDAHGHVFGVTINGGNGGANGWGTVFQITPAQLSETVLYRFCSQANCTDGINPGSVLARDGKGRLIGTTEYGGLTHNGILFRVDPKTLSESVLWNFCQKPNCADGANPNAGVTIDTSGDFFGTTPYGGAYASSNCDNTGLGCGTIYRLHGSRLTILQSFCKGGLPACASGAEPGPGTLLRDPAGNLLGTAASGGIHAGGTVFELTP